MSYPIAIREIVLKAPILQFKQVISWRDVAQSRRNMDDDSFHRAFLADTAARALGTKFIEEIRRRALHEQRETTDGVVHEWTVCALRENQLLDLLYEAYRVGFSDARDRIPMEIIPSPGVIL